MERFAGSLATYPFDASEVAAVVSKVGAPEPLTLRTLNRILNEGFWRESVRRGSSEAITTLADDELLARTIKTAEIYAELVSEISEIHRVAA